MVTNIEPRILRVPYEEGTYWRKGTKDGPDAILNECKKLREYSLMNQKRIPYDVNNIEVTPPHIEPYSKANSLKNIEASVDKLITSGYAPYIIGGDHSISLPVIRSLTNYYGTQSFGIIHLDAHSDTFDAVDGYDYHHGAVFRNIVEEQLVAPQDIYQLGIRGLVRGNGLDFADKHEINYLFMHEFRDLNLELAKFCPNTDIPYYVSIDIDAVDPAFAPGTGTPVPGGFSSSEILNLIQQLMQYQVIGMDLVEVAPIYDTSNITILLAAHILFESLSAVNFCQPNINKKEN